MIAHVLYINLYSFKQSSWNTTKLHYLYFILHDKYFINKFTIEVSKIWVWTFQISFKMGRHMLQEKNLDNIFWISSTVDIPFQLWVFFRVFYNLNWIWLLGSVNRVLRRLIKQWVKKVCICTKCKFSLHFGKWNDICLIVAKFDRSMIPLKLSGNCNCTMNRTISG